MFNGNTDVHVRAYRLATLSLRRDILRYARGSVVTKRQQCATLTEWCRQWEANIIDVEQRMGLTVARKETNQLDWKGFKDFKLTPAQLETFGLWEVHDDDLLDLVQGVLSQGYKVTFTYNAQSDTYNAAMTCNILKHPDQGYTLSAFAPAFYPALRLLMYKHWELCQGDWSNIPEPQRGKMG